MLAAAWLAACEPVEQGDAGGGASDLREITIPGVDAPLRTGDTVVVVNGMPVGATMYRLYEQNRQRQHPLGQNPDRAALSNELANLVLLAQEAEKEGLSEHPDIQGRLQYQWANTLAAAMMSELAERDPVTDDQIRSEYQRRYAQNRQTEYRTRNILVHDKPRAQYIIQELRRGREFAELAKEYSQGPAATSGGALEWFRPDDVIPEFAQAVAQLEKGEFTRKPVRTTYGWHVILLEDTRSLPPPPIEEARYEIRQSLLEQRLDDYIQKLRANADIRTK